MKKILIITYYWPPSGGAAVQRWLSFANGLASSDYTVHVLTVDEKYATYQLRDDSLLQHVHPAIQVHTTKTSEPFKFFTFFFGKKSIPKPAFANESKTSLVKKATRFIRGNLFIPDPRKGWKPYAVKKALKIIQSQKIDCLITAGPPHSSHFIGKELKDRFGIFWMADFHDLWTDVIYYDMLYHLPAIKKIDQRLERTILESADIVITVGDKYKEKLLSKSKALKPEKIKVLRIGYDEKLFATAAPAKVQGAFVITYTGTIADFYQPLVFISALKKVVQNFPGIKFKLRFAGVLSTGIKQQIFNAGLENILEDFGYVSHKQSIELLLSSTLLLLVNPVTKDEAMVIPGKVYEYLAACKPIVNITKATAETATIIHDCNAGKTFDRVNETDLEEYLNELVKIWTMTGKIDLDNNAGTVIKYSRGAITKSLINLIEQFS